MSEPIERETGTAAPTPDVAASTAPADAPPQAAAVAASPSPEAASADAPPPAAPVSTGQPAGKSAQVPPIVVPRIPDSLRPTIERQPVAPPAQDNATEANATDSLKGLLTHLLHQFIRSLKTRLIVMAISMLVIFFINTWLVAVINDGFGSGPHWWWVRQIATLHSWFGHGSMRVGLVWTLLSMIVFGIISRYRRMGRQAASQAYSHGFSRWLKSWLLPAGSWPQVLHVSSVLAGLLVVVVIGNGILTLLLGLALFLSICVFGDSLLITFLNAAWQDWHRWRKTPSAQPFPAEKVMTAVRGLSFGLAFFSLLYFLLAGIHLTILMLIPFLALVAWLVLNAIKMAKPVQIGTAMILICLACVILPVAMVYADDGGLSEAGGNWWTWMTSEGALPLYQDSTTAAALSAFGIASAAGFSSTSTGPTTDSGESTTSSDKRKPGKDFSKLGWKQDDKGNWWRIQVTPTETISYQYDTDGRLMTRVRTQADLSYTVTAYQVDEQGQIIGSDNARCKPDGTATDRWLEKEDRYGNKTREHYTLDQYEFRDGQQRPHITRSETTNGQFTTAETNFRPDGTKRNEFSFKHENVGTTASVAREAYFGDGIYKDTGTIIHYDQNGTTVIGQQNIVYDSAHNVQSMQCTDAAGHPISQLELNQLIDGR